MRRTVYGLAFVLLMAVGCGETRGGKEAAIKYLSIDETQGHLIVSGLLYRGDKVELTCETERGPNKRKFGPFMTTQITKNLEYKFKIQVPSGYYFCSVVASLKGKKGKPKQQKCKASGPPDRMYLQDLVKKPVDRVYCKVKVRCPSAGSMDRNDRVGVNRKGEAPIAFMLDGMTEFVFQGKKVPVKDGKAPITFSFFKPIEDKYIGSLMNDLKDAYMKFPIEIVNINGRYKGDIRCEYRDILRA